MSLSGCPSVLLLLPLLVLPALAEDHTFQVTGRFICQKLPMEGVVVEPWEHDTLSRDDPAGAAVTSSSNGTFYVQGKEDEIIKSMFEPFIYVYHKCNVPAGKKRKIKFNVPKRYVDADVYDMKTIALDIRYSFR